MNDETGDIQREAVVFRVATPADVPALVRLRVAFLAEVGGTDADEGLPDALEQYFSQALPSGEFIAYVAVAAGDVVATSGMVYHRHPPSPSNPRGLEAYLMNMYTLSSWRRRGLASQLLRLCLDHARLAGCSRAVLHALPLGRRIYELAGSVAAEGEMRLPLDV